MACSERSVEEPGRPHEVGGYGVILPTHLDKGGPETGMWPYGESDLPIVVRKRGNARGAKGQEFDRLTKGGRTD